MGVYTNYTILGPYSNKKKRVFIIAVSPNGIRKTISYPRYIMEKHLGRYIKDTEHIHHIDKDITNNDIVNLRLMDGEEHLKMHGAEREIEMMDFICPCGKAFEYSARKYRYNNIKKGKAGPYCSKQCAGRYSKKGPMVYDS